MAVPKYDELMNPVLNALKLLGGSAHIRDIEKKVAEEINLSQEDLNDIHRGTTTKLVYRLAWSRNYLKRFGVIKKTARSVWALTDEGSKIDSVDIEEVKRTVKGFSDDPEDLEDDMEDSLSSMKWFENENDVLEGNWDEENSLIDIEDIVSPFNPKDIQIIVEPKTIDHLVSRLRHKEIDLNTEFQRKGNLWSNDKQCRLIESILLRLPLPAFYFDASDDNKWLVVDGLQRLWSLKKFITNSEIQDLEELKNIDNRPIELTGLEILTELNNKEITYDKLNRTMQRRILETPITTYLIQPGTPKNVKYNVFKRINSGGVGLNAMEIRNALNQSAPPNQKSPSQFLKELSENFRLRNILKLQDKRMEDRELLLRAYSFIVNDYKKYTTPLSTFLDKNFETLFGKTDNELNKLSEDIIDAIYFQRDLFGKHLFSRSIVEGSTRLNSALFEVWISETYKLTNEQRKTLVHNKENLINDYRQLLYDENFLRAVVSSTSGKRSVEIRFERLQELINKYSK